MKFVQLASVAAIVASSIVGVAEASVEERVSSSRRRRIWLLSFDLVLNSPSLYCFQTNCAGNIRN